MLESLNKMSKGAGTVFLANFVTAASVGPVAWHNPTETIMVKVRIPKEFKDTLVKWLEKPKVKDLHSGLEIVEAETEFYSILIQAGLTSLMSEGLAAVLDGVIEDIIAKGIEKGFI